MAWLPWVKGEALSFAEWRRRCIAWLDLELSRHGAKIRRVRVAGTGSAYVEVVTRAGVECCIRLADHRTTRMGDRLLSVRLRGAARLRQVGSWLSAVDRRWQKGAVDATGVD